MNDFRFHGSLDGAKLIARNEEKEVVRRVQFKFGCDFGMEYAEWLDCEPLRTKLMRGDLDTFEIPIDAFHAKASFSGTKGNAKVQVQGVSAAAKMSGGEEPEPRITITLEAFPDATMLSWLAASIKEYVDVELLALQGELPAMEPAPPAKPKRQVEIPGTAKPEKKTAKKRGKRR
jgi:hypothetical protein